MEGFMKTNTRTNQLNMVYQYLKQHTASRFMVAVQTSIPVQNVCRYIKMLRDENRVGVYKIDKCGITGEWVEILTTNPDLFPKSNQLSFFD